MSSKQILVVDDEPMVCESLMRLLRHDGYRTQIAKSGMEALARFELTKFDLVLLDYAMPEMLGDEVAQALRHQDSCVPIIMLAACPPEPPPRDVDLVMIKPASLEELRNAISTVVCKTGKLKDG